MAADQSCSLTIPRSPIFPHVHHSAELLTEQYLAAQVAKM
jgi:hypothetical protein